MRIRFGRKSVWSRAAPLVAIALCLGGFANDQGVAQTRNARQVQSIAADKQHEFPPELVNFRPFEGNPVFTAKPGSWDAKIRERGWISKEGDEFRLWYTGYDGGPESLRMLGLATSSDGVHWRREPRFEKPLVADAWIEDMMIVRQGDLYYMFAEGRNDQAQLWTSPDGVAWTHAGALEIRRTNNEPISPGPYGTPTALCEDGVWKLLYERSDKGVWLAESKDAKLWTHVQDEPVLTPGPGEYDGQMIAVNQVIRHDGRYFAYYHGSGSKERPRVWTTNIAVSSDLIHWSKYAHNPLVAGNESSGIVVADGDSFRLYTMHDQVRLHLPK